MATLRVIDINGTPFETGVQHGTLATAEIAENLRIYFDRFQREAQLTLGQVRERAQRYLALIEATHPSYGEAMRGISQGAGIPLVDIAALNVRYELLYSQYSAINQAKSGLLPAGECTAFAVLPEVTRDGHLYLGQNWDWFPQVRGVVLRMRDADGFTVVAFTEAGIVGGKIGMNSLGLGLVINGLLSTDDDWSRLRTPFHVRTWQILHARTLNAATRAITDEDRSCSANFLLGQANGSAEVIDIEAAPGATCALTPQRGLLTHANHFMDPKVLGVGQPLAEEKLSTFHRAARLKILLEEGKATGRLTAEGLMDILRDHDGRPDSVCRHPNPQLPEEERVESVVSVIEDLTARRMFVAAGPPCQAEFQLIALSAH